MAAAVEHKDTAMGLERILSLLDGDDPGTEGAKLAAFQVVLALVIFTEYATKALATWELQRWPDWIAVAAAGALAGLAVHPRFRRLAFAGFALLQLGWVWTYFPHTGNHRYLELFLAGLFALLDDRDEAERRWLLRSVRWAVIVVLFYAGVQKLVHGYWHNGQFLAYSLWREPFRAALGPLLAAPEVERLTSYTASVGEGPYRVSSLPFLVLSNSVWVAEIALAAALFVPRTRRFAWPAACVLLVATELVAREAMFGIEFFAALTLFARSDRTRKLVGPAATVLAVLLMIRIGLLPEVTFH